MPAWAMRKGGAPAIGRPVEADLAGAHGEQAHEGADGGGLAHAVAAHQAHHLAGADGEVDAVEHLLLAVAGLESRDVEQRRAHADSPR